MIYGLLLSPRVRNRCSEKICRCLLFLAWTIVRRSTCSASSLAKASSFIPSITPASAVLLANSSVKHPRRSDISFVVSWKPLSQYQGTDFCYRLVWFGFFFWTVHVLRCFEFFESLIMLLCYKTEWRWIQNKCNKLPSTIAGWGHWNAVKFKYVSNLNIFCVFIMFDNIRDDFMVFVKFSLVNLKNNNIVYLFS